MAAAIADNPNYATDVANLVATKADTTYVDTEISDLNTLAQGYASTAETNAIAYADGLTTSDIAEGTNLYFTDGRARSAILPGTGVNLNTATGYIDVNLGTGLETDGSNNIQIDRTTVDSWYDASGSAASAQTAAISAAAADATTKANAAQAAAEATAAAALSDVLDATTPFTDLNINDVAKQVAARTTSLGSVVVTAYQFNKSTFKSGKFLVKIDNGTHNEISEILVTLDSSDNVAITEYAIVGTNGSRGTITADVDGTHCRIRVNPVNDSTITVAGTVFNA